MKLEIALGFLGVSLVGVVWPINVSVSGHKKTSEWMKPSLQVPDRQPETAPRLVVKPELTDAVRSVVLSDDAKWLITGGDDKTARLWALFSGTQIRCFRGHTGIVTSVCFVVGDGISIFCLHYLLEKSRQINNSIHGLFLL